MKKTILLITFGLVVIAALALAGLAYAQDATPTTPTTPWGGRGAYGGGMMGGANSGAYSGAYSGGMMGRSFGNGARGTGTGPMHTYMVEAFAQALDLTVEDVQAQFEAGATMWQIASDQGLSDEAIQGVMIQARTVALDAMVAEGLLTQEQADLMLERMNTMMSGDFTPGSCPMGGSASSAGATGAGAGFRGGRGRGMMSGWGQPTTP